MEKDYVVLSAKFTEMRVNIRKLNQIMCCRYNFLRNECTKHTFYQNI